MPGKNPPTTFRFDPTTRAALHLIAERDGRSMANMLEWLVRKHCVSEGLGWPPAGVAGVAGLGAGGVVKAAAPAVPSAPTPGSGYGERELAEIALGVVMGKDGSRRVGEKATLLSVRAAQGRKATNKK